MQSETQIDPASLLVVQVSFGLIEAFTRRDCCTDNVRRKHRLKCVIWLKVQILLKRAMFHYAAQRFAPNLHIRGDHRARVNAVHRVDQEPFIAQKGARKNDRCSRTSHNIPHVGLAGPQGLATAAALTKRLD